MVDLVKEQADACVGKILDEGGDITVAVAIVGADGGWWGRSWWAGNSGLFGDGRDGHDSCIGAVGADAGISTATAIMIVRVGSRSAGFEAFHERFRDAITEHGG